MNDIKKKKIIEIDFMFTSIPGHANKILTISKFPFSTARIKAVL